MTSANSSCPWLYYYPHYEALVCTTHGYAVADLASHLLKRHTDLDWPTRQGLIQHYGQQSLGGPSQQQLQGKAIAPVAGLPIHHGFRCQRCPDFVTINWKSCKI